MSRFVQCLVFVEYSYVNPLRSVCEQLPQAHVHLPECYHGYLADTQGLTLWVNAHP